MSTESEIGARAARLADAIRDFLATELAREQRGTIITVAAVTLSPDSRKATAWLRAFPEEQTPMVVREANTRSRFYYHGLVHHLRRRIVPVIAFAADPSIQSESAINALLR